MTDTLLASLGMLDPGTRTSLTHADVVAELVPLVRAIASGVVQPFTVSEWAALSPLTRGAIDEVLTVERVVDPLESGEYDGTYPDAEFDKSFREAGTMATVGHSAHSLPAPVTTLGPTSEDEMILAVMRNRLNHHREAAARA